MAPRACPFGSSLPTRFGFALVLAATFPGLRLAALAPPDTLVGHHTEARAFEPVLVKDIVADADLSGVEFLPGADLRRAEFTGGRWADTSFNGADLTEALFTGVVLARPDFRYADLPRAAFHRCLASNPQEDFARWAATRWVDGTIRHPAKDAGTAKPAGADQPKLPGAGSGAGAARGPVDHVEAKSSPGGGGSGSGAGAPRASDRRAQRSAARTAAPAAPPRPDKITWKHNDMEAWDRLLALFEAFIERSPGEPITHATEGGLRSWIINTKKLLNKPGQQLLSAERAQRFHAADRRYEEGRLKAKAGGRQVLGSSRWEHSFSRFQAFVDNHPGEEFRKFLTGKQPNPLWQWRSAMESLARFGGLAEPERSRFLSVNSRYRAQLQRPPVGAGAAGISGEGVLPGIPAGGKSPDRRPAGAGAWSARPGGMAPVALPALPAGGKSPDRLPAGSGAEAGAGHREAPSASQPEPAPRAPGHP
jgi:hypothetical protein